MGEDSKKNINVVKLVEWRKDEESAIYEGPEKGFFAMFAEWQPRYITISRLMTKRIGEGKQRLYCESFVDFYLQKPRFFCNQYQWNMRFMDHCLRRFNWEMGINSQYPTKKGEVGEWISTSQWKKLTAQTKKNDL